MELYGIIEALRFIRMQKFNGIVDFKLVSHQGRKFFEFFISIFADAHNLLI